MGKSKIKLSYRFGKLPEDISELMKKADKTDLKVLLTISLLAKRTTAEASIEDIAEVSGLDGSDVKASLKFWRGAGVVEDSDEVDAEEAQTKTEPAEKKPASTAHRNGALEQSGAAADYSTAELADIIEKRIVTPYLIDEAQRIFGKIFRTYDIGILAGIVERLGFEEEAVLLMLHYAAGKGKKTMRYVEKFAMALYDEGVTETSDVAERIDRMIRSGEVIEQIKRLYGIKDRELTTSEKKYFTDWTEKYVYDIEVIRMAYDITVDNTQKPVPHYTNKILERWYSEGLRTAEEVNGFVERQRIEKSGSKVTKSYDTDEFFEAALRRSYEEII